MHWSKIPGSQTPKWIFCCPSEYFPLYMQHINLPRLCLFLLGNTWNSTKNHHQISKITTCRKKPHFHQWEPAFIISLGWVAWGFFFSFNKMFLDELTWILLVPNDLIHLPQQDKLTGLLWVRVTITSARGGKARDEGSAGLSCDLMNSHLALSSFLIICYPT